MNYVTVKMWDITGTKRMDLKAPSDVPVGAIISSIVEKMGLPKFDNNGMQLSYKMVHKSSGKHLLGQQTLASAGVKDNDVIRILAEMVAGAI